MNTIFWVGSAVCSAELALKVRLNSCLQPSCSSADSCRSALAFTAFQRCLYACYLRHFYKNYWVFEDLIIQKYQPLFLLITVVVYCSNTYLLSKRFNWVSISEVSVHSWLVSTQRAWQKSAAHVIAAWKQNRAIVPERKESGIMDPKVVPSGATRLWEKTCLQLTLLLMTPGSLSSARSHDFWFWRKSC